jgi:lysozyme
LKKPIIACSVTLIIGLLIAHGQLRINKAVLAIIGDAEGCYLTPYVCPAGILTDGIGNTHHVSRVTQKTVDGVAQDWELNILIAENCINVVFDGKAMPVDTFSAMVSAVFNLGCYRLRTYYNAQAEKRVETTIHKLAKRHQWKAMCQELPSFTNGDLYPGLIARRAKEMQLCLQGVNSQ